MTPLVVAALALAPLSASASTDPSDPSDPSITAPAVAPDPAVGGTQVWGDGFARGDGKGWGDGYVSTPAYVASVQDGSGVIALRGGHRSILAATTGVAADGVVGATLQFSSIPNAGYGATTIVTSRNGETGSYGARFRLDTQSRGVLSIARYDADDVQTVLRQDLLLIDVVPADAAVRVEIETVGSEDVTIRARAWIAGAEAPDWQMSVTDRSDAAITSAGTSGISTYLSPGNRSLAVRVDDLSLASTEVLPVPVPEPEPSPEPTPAVEPTEQPTPVPTDAPVPEPTDEPSPTPTQEPSPEPTVGPTPAPTEEPSPEPTATPTPRPTPTPAPTATPTPAPTLSPSPTASPTSTPTPTPTPTSTPSPTPEPTTPPVTTPPPTTTPPTGTTLAGSIPVGQTAYPVPDGAIHVIPAGSRASGSGSAANPIAGAQAAIDAAPSGATIVLHAGTYRESVTVPFFKKLTIQSAPGEAVWFDGSRPVSGWTASGGTWVAPWSTFFDSRVSFSQGRDETSWWVNSSNPLAGFPDQVWIEGTPLTQVGSRSAVTAGTFYVDQSARQLVIGSDPGGRTVSASALAKAIKIQGAGTTVRGIGVQRYATTVALLGAVSAEVDGITLENMVIRDNATVGLFAWNDHKMIRNVTATGNGLLGIAVNDVTDLTIENSLITGNNAARFNYTPVAGGVKMSRASDVTVTRSIISDNVASTGLWFDVSSSDLTITDNVFEGNGREGVEIELSQTAIVAGNYIIGNGNSGLFVFDSGDVDVWNNTMVGNGRTITYMQDERRQEVASLRSLIPWVTSDVVVRNNVLSYGGQACPMLTQDLTNRWYGNDFGVSQDANLYHRTSASSPSNFACWADGPKGTRGFTTIEEFRAHTGGDARSVLVQGAPVVDPVTWQLTAPSPVSGAFSLTGTVAALLGIAPGTVTVGAPKPPVTAR
ncbi:right-handed parallel beta-helix repeat-containing protein [Microbacterium sp. GCS4]|uniref:right-handed parallel beta-helix repeat-containing protein n=1 Tax=Microbacterium sp. GCS4 TaxID=1692239 RepID=UPI000683100F|nr:right-handed parallel beta-helix repeat-containing protein [Microbacterium sp. GCS4]